MWQLAYQLQLVAVLSSFIIACGTEGDTPPAPSLEQIIHPSTDEISNGEVKVGSYLVAFKSSAQLQDDYGAYHLAFREHYALIGGESYDPAIEQMNFITALNMNPASDLPADEQVFGANLVTRFATKPYYAAPSVASLTQVDFRSVADAKRILQDWAARGRIWYAEPNYASQPFQTTTSTVNAWTTYAADYEKRDQYWNKNINNAAAFTGLAAIPESSQDRPIVAVLDSGLDIEHPQLSTNVWLNESPGEAGCGGTDLHGCNTTTGRNGVLGDGDIHPAKTEGYGVACPQDNSQCDKMCCHGTHVAGIIAATPNSDYAGICPVCRIMTVRIVGKAPAGVGGKESYSILDGWISAGLTYVSSFKRGSPVRIINASFGQGRRSRSIAIQVAALANSGGNTGTIIIGAAGNEDSSRVQYPAGYEDAISVANVTSSNDKHISSNFGSWVDIAAPGHDIQSSIPGGGKEGKTGTSMAAPVVAGVAALIVAGFPNISARELRAKLLGSGDPTIYSTALNQNYLVKVPSETAAIPLLGSGLIKADAALKGTASTPILKPVERVGRGCGTIGKPGGNTSWLVFLWLLLPLLFVSKIFRWPLRMTRLEDIRATSWDI